MVGCRERERNAYDGLIDCANNIQIFKFFEIFKLAGRAPGPSVFVFLNSNAFQSVMSCGIGQKINLVGGGGCCGYHGTSPLIVDN